MAESPSLRKNQPEELTNTSGADAPEVFDPGPTGALTPSQRKLLVQVLGWLAGAVLILIVAVGTDWARLSDKFLDMDVAREQFPEVITVATKNTLLYAVFSFTLGLAFGLIGALARRSSVAIFRFYARLYIELFRGLPALLTIYMVGFALPIAMGVKVPSVAGLSGSGMLALALVAGAYMAETIRAGLQAVPKGQIEAARSLGMSGPRTTFMVVIPQAFRIVVPPLANEMILLLKDTALLSVLGTTTTTKELLKFGRDGAADFNMTPLVVVGLMYVALTIPLTQAVNALERRQARSR